jgi:hypothetical protein
MVKSGLDFFLIRWLWFSWGLGWNPSVGLLGWYPGVVLGWDLSVGFKWFSEVKEDLT